MIFDRFFKPKKEPDTYHTERTLDKDSCETIAEYAVQSIQTGLIQTEPVIPMYREDYGKAIFIWCNAKTSPVRKDDEYPRYNLTECGIVHPAAFHRQMIEEGFFAQDGFEKALESLKLSDLKEIAEEQGVSGSGKKADIIKRIVQSGDIGYLQRQFPTTYSLSEKGTTYIAEHDECIQLHKHKNWLIEWDEYCRVRETIDNKTFYGVCNTILLKRAASDKRTFGMVEYTFLSKLEEEFGDPGRSLRYLLQKAYISVSGVMGLDSYKDYKVGIYSKKMLEDMFVSNVTPISSIDQIRKHKDLFDDSIIDKLYTWKLPVMICEKSLFREIIHSILDGSYNNQFYEAQLKVRYSKYINSL